MSGEKIIGDSLFATVQRWNAKREWRLTPVGKLGRMELKEVIPGVVLNADKEKKSDKKSDEIVKESDIEMEVDADGNASKSEKPTPATASSSKSSEEEEYLPDCEEIVSNTSDSKSQNPIMATLASMQAGFSKLMSKKEEENKNSTTKVGSASSNSKSSNHYGKFLDAGTGVASLSWARSYLSYTHITAITAATAMRQMVISQVYKMGNFPGKRHILTENAASASGVSYTPEANVDILVGDWMNQSFYENYLKNQNFDTVLADYLIGAVDGFSPYTQDIIIDRMRESMRQPEYEIDSETGLKKQITPGGRFYLIALSPVEDIPNPSDKIQNSKSDAYARKHLVSEIRRARDSCILLANERPYREFPITWITRHLKDKGFEVLETRVFPIRHNELHVRKQLDVARTKLGKMDGVIAGQMRVYLDSLDVKIKNLFGKGQEVEFGSDYMVEAVIKGDASVGKAVNGGA